MTWTAYVPPLVEAQIRATLKDDDVVLARSWSDLEGLVGRHPLTPVLIDPTADGTNNVAAVLKLVRLFPSTPVLSCVTWDGRGFKAGVELAQYGVKSTILNFKPPFRELADKLSAISLARGILAWAERSLTLFPPELRSATFDLFERPRCYSTAAELALAANISLAAMYREFEQAQLGTPKKLVVVAKMAHAYQCIRLSKLRIASISTLVGFSRPRGLSDYTKAIFGCRPSRLRTQSNAEEAGHALLDWLYKPR